VDHGKLRADTLSPRRRHVRERDYDTPSSPVALNFAHALGSFSSRFAATIPAYCYFVGSSLYYSRLTTAAP